MHDRPEWQNAMRALIICAEHGQGGDPMLARIGMMRALYPPGEPVFDDTPRKEKHWGKRNLEMSATEPTE